MRLAVGIACLCFGRVCPGKAFADASLWLTAVNVIATMDLTFAKDSSGRDIVPEAGFLSGFIRFVRVIRLRFCFADKGGALAIRRSSHARSGRARRSCVS